MSIEQEKKQRRFTQDYQLHLTSSLVRTNDLLPCVYAQHVVLERLFIRGLSIYGSIRVNNLSLHKQVSLHYTIDRWKTKSILQAQYSMSHGQTNTDSFQFQWSVPIDELIISEQNPISTLYFAICYSTNEQTYWDNHHSKNYSIKICRVEDETRNMTMHPFFNEEERAQLAWEYEAIPNQSESNSSQPCALKNVGSACYMNSMLQALSFSPFFSRYCLSNPLLKGDRVMNEYVNILSLLHCNEYLQITPSSFKDILGHLRRAYLGNRQQDAHEFCIFLLDCFEEELESDPLNSSSTNPIVDFFYGVYQSITECVTCGRQSKIHEPFLTVNLPILHKDPSSLEECLAQLQTEECLDEDSWFCAHCQCRRTATKRLMFHQLPKILIIQLKRFEMKEDGELTKNETTVLYSTEDLHLRADVEDSYTLYAVINHHGNLQDGHYTTFARHLSLSSSPWWHCDDEQIRLLNKDELAKNNNAYVLFYATNKY